MTQIRIMELPNRSCHEPIHLVVAWRRTAGERSWTCAIVMGIALAGLLFGSACSRQHYRLRADADAYCLMGSRNIDPTWAIPERAVEPDETSRMALGYDPDCGPQPRDDPAANRWLRNPYRFRQNYWDRIPQTNQIENPTWLEHLPRTADGKVKIDAQLANHLALIHNREFQTRFEQVYLGAIRLSSNRFEFNTQWLGQVGAGYTAADNFRNEQIAVNERLGLRRSLAGGGQLLVDLLNSFTFQFAGGRVSTATGSIVATFTQPLLRNAGRFVRLEGLTQAERDLLYQVREFARFRRAFYAEVQEQYYGLLVQKQGIRNQRNNLNSLAANLEEHRFMQSLGTVPSIAVDQVFQQYQSGRIALFSAEQGLQNALDSFKFFLGLPPWIEIELDESFLGDFEFTPENVAALEAEIMELNTHLLPKLEGEPDLSPAEILASYERYLTLQRQLQELLPAAQQSLAAWSARIADAKSDRLDDDDAIDLAQQQRLVDGLSRRLERLPIMLEDDYVEEELESAIAELRKVLDSHNAVEDPIQGDDADPEKRKTELPDDLRIATERARAKLYTAVERRLGEFIGEIFLAETQSRLFALEIEPIRIEQADAIQYALGSRLDLMNRRGELVDAFRQVEIAANRLQSGLDFSSSVALGTDPTRNNPFAFESSEHIYRVGVEFDGPLNRFNERNAYRAAQIAYSQARRQFMAAEDSIANAVRRTLRDLQIRRLNFQIARQQFVAATRQVDQARLNLRAATEADSNLTRDLLTSLQSLLGAQNDIISNWVDFKLTKIRLFTELELLFLDDQGQWINEADGLDFLKMRLSQPDFMDFPRDEILGQDNAEENLTIDKPVNDSKK